MSPEIIAQSPLRVVVWGENRHEQLEPHVAEIYPDGNIVFYLHGELVEPL